MKPCTLKVLRDEHGFTPDKLRAARKYLKGKEHWDNSKEVADSVIEDTGLFLEMVYTKTDKELVDLNEAGARVGNTPVQVHGLTKETAVVTFPAGAQPYTYPIKDLNVDGLSMDKYLVKDTKASEPNTIIRREGEVVLEGSKINNFSAIQKLADELDSMDNIGTSDKHKKGLSKVLKVLFSGTKEPMENMNIYLSEKSRDNGGFIDLGKDAGIYLAKGQRDRTFGNDMSLIEKLVHELVHGSTSFGINHRSPEIAKQIVLLKELRSAAMKAITVEDLMGETVMRREVSERIAKERIKYMNENLEEFLAYALTHEGVMNKLQDVTITPKRKKYEGVSGLFDQLLDVLKDLFDTVLKTWTGKENRRTIAGDKLAMQLLSDFARVNHEVKMEQNTGVWSKIDNSISDMEARGEKWLNEKEQKATAKIQKLVEKRQKKTIWEMIQVGWFIATTEEGTPMMQDFLSNVLKQRPEGFIQTLMRHLKKSDAKSNRMQELTLAAGQLDEHRKSTIDKLTAMVSEVFKKPMTRAEKKAVYASMEVTDGYVLVNEYEKDTAELYTDETKLDAEIEKVQKRIESAIEDNGDKLSVISQVKGLAEWMNTGKGSIVQRRNAKAIAEYSVGMDEESLISDIDTLISLYAVKGLDESVRTGTATMLGKEYDGLLNMAKMNKGFKDYKKASMTRMQQSNFPKNYHREEYDGRVAMRIAKVKDRRELTEEGYVIAEKIPNNGLGVAADQLAVYKSTVDSREAFDRSSIKYVGDDANGRLLKDDLIASGLIDTIPELVRHQLDVGAKKAARYETEVRKGNTPKIDTTVIPEVDENGNVVDYRAVVSVASKIEHLGLETSPMGTVGRNWAHEADVEETTEHNELVWDEIIGDMMDEAPMNGSIGIKNKLAYIEVSKESGVFEVKDAARILPKALQDKLRRIEKAKKALVVARRMHKEGSSRKAIQAEMARIPGGSDVEYNNETTPTGHKKDFYQVTDEAVISVVGRHHWERVSSSRRSAIRRRLGRGHIMVRRDMILDTFGIRDLTAAEFISDKVFGKVVARELKKAIRMIESGWKEIVKIFKVDMIIRMLPVIMGNIISNLMYSVQYGHNPLKIARRQLEGVGALKDYLSSKKKLTAIGAKLSIEPDNTELQEEQARILSDMKLNPAMPLLDAHLYQHIVEDVGLEDFKSSSKIARMIDDKTEGVPQMVKTGVHWLFVTEKTSLFQLVTKATAYSDFVARYAQFTLSKEKELAKYERVNGKKMGADQVEALTDSLVIQVRDAYVNYSKPDSRLLQYFNDMGFVAFTKYAVRIQQAIGDLLRGRPLRFSMALIGQELFEATTGIDPEDIAEKSFFTRSPSGWFYTPGVETILGNIIEPQMYTNMKAALS